jgi:hypothetical protein
MFRCSQVLPLNPELKFDMRSYGNKHFTAQYIKYVDILDKSILYNIK